MLGKKKFQPKLMYNLTLDDLVAEDNIYRQIDKFLDMRFVYKECEKLYGKTGKPSIDPVVFFKLELFGYFENIISDRELIKKANDSLAARYFIGYDLDEKLPWHSTISRTRALISKEIFEKIFNRVLELCYQSGLIEGKHQSIDSTLVKANASLDSLRDTRAKINSGRIYQ
jgi:transposase